MYVSIWHDFSSIPLAIRKNHRVYKPQLTINRKMAIPRSEYLSSVWRDGIFGLNPFCDPDSRLISHIQTTKSSFALEEEELSAVLK